jgi:mono/diheme cytochrome c family protein
LIRRPGLIAAASVAGVVVSCAAPGARAPLVEGPVAEAAQRANSLAAAGQGRRIYVTACVDCHGARRPADYTPAEWDKILPKMALKAELTESERAQVRAYIDAVLSAGSPAGER